MIVLGLLFLGDRRCGNSIYKLCHNKIYLNKSKPPTTTTPSGPEKSHPLEAALENPIDDPCGPPVLAEQPPPPEPRMDTGWYLDIEEPYTAREYSIPLTRVAEGMTMSVAQFVSAINADIDDFFLNNDDDVQDMLGLTCTAGKYSAGVSHGHTQKELLISYHIKQTNFWSFQQQGHFKIKFITGPHGTNIFDFEQLGLLDPAEEDPQPDLYIGTDIISRPSTQVGDVPFSMGNAVTISDFPPVPPIVDIYPFRNINDRLMFMINGVSGDIEALPIQIETSDIEQFRNSYIAQGLPGAPSNITMEDVDSYVFENLIRFKSDGCHLHLSSI